MADIKLADVWPRASAAIRKPRWSTIAPSARPRCCRRIIERNEGPLPGETVAHIFREIMSACLALERPLQVAYLGPEGTFTQAAAIKHFGHAAFVCPKHD